jgi:hypothetical protein
LKEQNEKVRQCRKEEKKEGKKESKLFLLIFSVCHVNREGGKNILLQFDKTKKNFISFNNNREEVVIIIKRKELTLSNC